MWTLKIWSMDLPNTHFTAKHGTITNRGHRIVNALEHAALIFTDCAKKTWKISKEQFEHLKWYGIIIANHGDGKQHEQYQSLLIKAVNSCIDIASLELWNTLHDQFIHLVTKDHATKPLPMEGKAQNIFHPQNKRH